VSRLPISKYVPIGDASTKLSGDRNSAKVVVSENCASR
jgi:hypothetical protein